MKIGSAINPIERVSGLQTGCPYDCNIVAVSDVDERDAHEEYCNLRRRGEWFDWTTGEIAGDLVEQYMDVYGDDTEMPWSECAATIGGSVAKAKSMSRPYRLYPGSITTGEWELCCDDRLTIPAGIRLFDPIFWVTQLGLSRN